MLFFFYFLINVIISIIIKIVLFSPLQNFYDNKILKIIMQKINLDENHLCQEFKTFVENTILSTWINIWITQKKRFIYRIIQDFVKKEIEQL